MGRFANLFATCLLLAMAIMPLHLRAAPAATSLAVGGTSCAVTSDNALMCWVGTTHLDTLKPFTALGNTVAAASRHSGHGCAINLSGGVSCWGENTFGQLGDGTLNPNGTPVAVVGMSSGVASISTSYKHTCALTTAGQVYCWGLNKYGELGDGTGWNSALPKLVSGLAGDTVAITSGTDHSCALSSAGGVKCWGYNGSGQIGDGTSLNNRMSPVQVSGLTSGVTAIAAGESHTCALTSAGAVLCWGSNDRRQLGIDSPYSRTVPNQVTGMTAGVAAITAYGKHNCALLVSGGLSCWGENTYGQLGNGSTASAQPIPAPVSGLASGVTAIAAGNQKTCALMATGGVKCWGYNYSGALGDGTDINRPTPVNVLGFDSDGDGLLDDAESDDDGDGVEDVADNCLLVANADQLDTDGDGLGNPCDNDDDADGVWDVSDKFPLQYAAATDNDNDGYPDNWTAACDAACQASSGLVLDNCPYSPANPDQLDTDADGAGNACDTDDDNDGVIDLSDAFPLDPSEWADSDRDGTGNVVDADDDNDGTLDAGDNCPVIANAGQSDADADGKGDLCDLQIQTRQSIVAVGYSHSCAVTAAGGVKCWGTNGYGQLGDGTGSVRSTPVDVVGLASPVKSVVAGDSFSCALTVAGAVQCWGYNNVGQLGDNTLANRTTPVNVVGLGSGVKAISAGGLHTCAVLVTGAVKCWGYNANGRLGDGTTVNRQVPVQVVGLEAGVASVEAGYEHTCAVMESGTVKCWGKNTYGQLGHGNSGVVPSDVEGLGGFAVSVSAGGNHSCALMETGSLKCWGYNVSSQLGNTAAGNSSLAPVAADRLGVAGVMYVTAGYDHTCILADADGVQCWGANSKGQLGDSTFATQAMPVDAVGLAAGVRTVSANYRHACALLASGEVWCWGNNENAQLGDGTWINRNVPVMAGSGFYQTDTDMDGISDALDLFPLDPAESLDTDNDGTGNNADLDDDNDSVPDYIDAAPLNPANSSERTLLLDAPYRGGAITESQGVSP